MAANQPQDGTPGSVVLARAEVRDTITTLFDSPVTVRVVVSVVSCPYGYPTRLGYHARLLRLERDGSRETEIAALTSWRLCKPTWANEKVGPAWQADWHTAPYEAFPGDTGGMALCVKALYRAQQGGRNLPLIGTPLVAAPAVAAADRALLSHRGHDLVYIASFWTRDLSQHQGLGYYLMVSYHEIMSCGILPPPYTIPGTVTYLLIPAMLAAVPNNANFRWLLRQETHVLTDAQLDRYVEAQLTAMFLNPIYRQRVFLRDAPVVDNISVTVIAHTMTGCLPINWQTYSLLAPDTPEYRTPPVTPSSALMRHPRSGP